MNDQGKQSSPTPDPAVAELVRDLRAIQERTAIHWDLLLMHAARTATIQSMLLRLIARVDNRDALAVAEEFDRAALAELEALILSVGDRAPDLVKRFQIQYRLKDDE